MFAQVGTLTGTGMSICNLYSFSVCPNQIISPYDYGNQGYACTGNSMPDVSFNINGPVWRVMKYNWFFSATTSGQVKGYDASGNLQSFPFLATNTISPLSYSGNYVQFAVNGVATGTLLNQATFSISLNPVVFGSNTFTYCPISAPNVTINPVLPSQGGPWTYTWQPGNILGNPAVVSPSISTTYSVYAKSTAGCISTTTVLVSVNCPTVPLCSGNLGNPVFLEDFGSGTSLYGPALPPGVTNYIYQTGPPPNGSYVISSSSNPSGINLGYVNDRDHTGNLNGYMMVVNSDYPASEVYRKHVTGLCQNTTYVFSAFLSNNNTPTTPNTVCPGYVYANVRFQIEYPVSNIQNFVTTGNLPLGLSNTQLNWQQYGFVFTTLPGQTSVDVVLKNNAPGGCGNDYVVDDISLSPCGPKVETSISPNKSIFCIGENLTFQSNFVTGSYSNPQYQWQFSNNGGIAWSNIIGANSANYNISSLNQSNVGLYQLLISESGNINSSSCRIVAGPLTFSLSPGVNIPSTYTICSGTTATLIATGATSYTWNNGANTNSIIVNPSSTTTYSVYGVSSGTCTNQAMTTVNVVPASTVAITGNTVICAGQTTTLTASGNGNYLWSNSITSSSIIVSPIVTTSYSATSLTNSCVNTAPITVTVNPLPNIIVSGNINLCAGESTVLNASGADTYLWSNGVNSSSISVSPTSSTTYSLTGVLASCTNTQIVTVNVNTPPTITQVNITNADCGINNGGINVSVISAAASYLWSNGNTGNNISGLSSGVYSLAITNNGCVTHTVFLVSSNNSPVITSVLFNNTSCGLSNGTATVNTNASNYSYNWNSVPLTNENTQDSLAAGSYTVIVSNGSCQTQTVITILASQPLVINSSSISPSDCNVPNGEILVSDNYSASSYSWSPNTGINSGTLTAISAGIYSLAITNGACQTFSVFNVPQKNPPTSFTTFQTAATCRSADGTSRILKINNGHPPYQVSFNGMAFSSNFQYDSLNAGVFPVIIKDSFDCIYVDSIIVEEKKVPAILNFNVELPDCEGTNGELVVNEINGGEAPYLLNFNSLGYSENKTYNNLEPGNYLLTVLDSNRCETNFLIPVSENKDDYTIYAPNSFTPNNDKINDVWYVQGVCIKQFHCNIYNRWGQKIKELNDISEGWDGLDAPNDIYVYKLEVKTKYNVKVHKTGHITLLK